MANNQYVNKLVVNGVTKLDLSGDTITASSLEAGYKAHDSSGKPITGTYTGINVVVEDMNMVYSDDGEGNITITEVS